MYSYIQSSMHHGMNNIYNHCTCWSNIKEISVVSFPKLATLTFVRASTKDATRGNTQYTVYSILYIYIYTVYHTVVIIQYNIQQRSNVYYVQCAYMPLYLLIWSSHTSHHNSGALLLWCQSEWMWDEMHTTLICNLALKSVTLRSA